MLQDHYGYNLSTTSQTARDAYVDASKCMLAGLSGIAEGFQAATQEDPSFALAWVGLARAHQFSGNMQAVAHAIGEAQNHRAGLTEREASHQ